jgi:hypothetical protein
MPLTAASWNEYRATCTTAGARTTPAIFVSTTSYSGVIVYQEGGETRSRTSA